MSRQSITKGSPYDERMQCRRNGIGMSVCCVLHPWVVTLSVSSHTPRNPELDGRRQQRTGSDESSHLQGGSSGRVAVASRPL